MVDVVLLVGRLLFLALLFLFLFATVKTGVGLVSRGGPQKLRTLGLVVTAGPREIKGIKVPLDQPVRIGRAPGQEVVIADDFVSQHHARAVPTPQGPVLEDLGSTNGTVLNGKPLTRPSVLVSGDVVEIGTTSMKVSAL